MKMRFPRWRAVAATILVVGLAAGCGSGANAASGEKASSSSGGALPAAKLSLVAYSTPQEAYEKLIDAFRATPQGRNISFSTSFGASGDQSRAVASGLDADVVAFSLAPDITRLVKGGIVADDWNTGATKGMVTDSVVVFVVRKGNPKSIKSWADLTKPGVEVITPNPFTSGGARWNVMAAYGQASRAGDAAAGEAYLKALFHNVPVQDDSARKALSTFTSGKGDVMLAYENEAIFAQQKGQAIDYVVPSSTILIENPVAVTKTSKHPAQAEAFLEFLQSPKAQQVFADNGYRPAVKGVATTRHFPTPSKLFTIDDLGGWDEVMKKFFDPNGSVMATVERDLGVSVG